MQQPTATDPKHKLRSANAAIAREELVGLSFMLWGRLAVLGLLAIWILMTVSEQRSIMYLGLIAAFALLGALKTTRNRPIRGSRGIYRTEQAGFTGNAITHFERVFRGSG